MSEPTGPDGVLAFDGLSLSDEDATRIVRHEVERANIQRARLLAPILAVVHIVHVLVFHLAEITGGGSEVVAALWRERLAMAHTVAATVTTLLALVTFRGPRTLAARALPLVGVFYLVHGAWIASIDQLVTPAMTTPSTRRCPGSLSMTRSRTSRTVASSHRPSEMR